MRRFYQFKWFTTVFLCLSVLVSCTNQGNGKLTEGSGKNPNQDEKQGTVTDEEEFRWAFLSDPEMLKRSLVNEGNPARIAAAMEKASSGKAITIGFIGGSITEGAFSSKPETSYAGLIHEWWKKKFPQSSVTLKNAAISGTGSIIGVHRVKDELLQSEPDFVVVEFAVNDTAEKVVNEAFECLIREILDSRKKPGVLLLFMCNDKGQNTQSAKVKVGNHYDLPMISYKDAVWPDILSKKIQWNDISPDFIHPNDKGHRIAADIVINYLESVYKKSGVKSDIDIEMPAPLQELSFTNTQFLTKKNFVPQELGGFEPTDHAAGWGIKEGFAAKEKNNPMKFDLKAKSLYIVYRKTVDRKAGRIKVSVNGEEKKVLDANSTNGGEYIAFDEIFAYPDAGTYSISIEFTDEAYVGCTGEEFYLLAFLVSK